MARRFSIRQQVARLLSPTRVRHFRERRRSPRAERLEPRQMLTTYFVDDGFDAATPGWGVDHFASIQDAVDAADPAGGDIVEIAPGTYDEPIDIDGFHGLTINGAGPSTVTLAPASTLDWNIGGYVATRQAVVRVVNSTDVRLQGMTMDFDAVKANGVHGILYWDSTGTIHNNVLQNMSVDDTAGGYREIGSYLRAPGYSHGSRAEITVSNNTFIDTGRIGVNTHDYVDATITGNSFYKTTADFGYAIQLGSESVGEISDNTVFGYDTLAADGSHSAGIYIENTYTNDVASPGFSKNVSVTDNDISGCLWGMYVGNTLPGMAGDVDIHVTAADNDFFNNSFGGVVLTDQGASAGSSVRALFRGNELSANGDYGYFIYSPGDGDITASLMDEEITSNDVGIYVDDYGQMSHLSVDVTASDLSRNASFGVQNQQSAETATSVKAAWNWWGSSDGPSGKGAGSGDAVSENVDFFPWWMDADMTVPSVASEVVGRHIFYNNCAWDGDDPAPNTNDDMAIAPPPAISDAGGPDKELGKWALLPGETATFVNYTSYDKGINGIMVDTQWLTTTPTVADFEFRVGNSSDPSTWAIAPSPQSITVREDAGTETSDRITVIWPDNAIENQWLQVTVLATENTRLAEASVFYFGNAIGETGNSTIDTMVTSVDEIGARHNMRVFPLASVYDAYDFNRDKIVASGDQIIARHHTAVFDTLKLITAPAADAALEQALEQESGSPATSSVKLQWLPDLGQITSARQSSQRDDRARDRLIDALMSAE